MTDEEINDPANIPFLINGVLNDYSSAHTYVSLWADLLSDALVNDGKVQGSTDVRENTSIMEATTYSRDVRSSLPGDCKGLEIC